MMRTTLTFSAVLLAATFSLAAQGVVTPPGATTTQGGSSLGFPFSYGSYVRYQQAIDKKYLKIGNIYGLSFRSRTTTSNIPERQWQDMSVTLSDLPASSVSGMSSTYSSNFAKNATQVFSGKFNIYRQNTGDPLEFNVTIAFDKPFLYLATSHLLVDLWPNGAGYEGNSACGQGGNGTGMDGTRDSGIYSLIGKGSCGTGPTSGSVGGGGLVIQFYYSPMAMPLGKGCPGSASSSPRIGSTGSATLGSKFSFTMSGAPANSKNSVFLLGASDTTDISSARLPVDLSALTPAKSCWQSVSADLLVFLAISSGGSSIGGTLPTSTSIKGVPIFGQFAVDDPGIGGFSTTQGAVIRPQ